METLAAKSEEKNVPDSVRALQILFSDRLPDYYVHFVCPTQGTHRGCELLETVLNDLTFGRSAVPHVVFADNLHQSQFLTTDVARGIKKTSQLSSVNHISQQR